MARKHDHVERLVADGAVLVDQPLEAQSGGTDWTDELLSLIHILLYLVASHLIRKGHPLAAVLDQTPPSNMLKAAPHLPAGLLGLPLLLLSLIHI